ncbi:hypothetical protein [Nocardia asteroides]|uniref:hypothetical protein n=1 Tax=Nocardia asteroides TaxID=1824 RepID=UPI00342FB6B6
MRGETAEFNETARFLRDLMDEAELTSKDLQVCLRTRLAEATIGNRLAGVGLTWEFMEDVVLACTERAELRRKRPQYLQHAKKKWEIAQNSRTSPVVVDAKTSQGSLTSAVIDLQRTAVDLHERLHAKQNQLTAARTARAHAELALRSSSALAAALSPWVLILLNEIDHLTRERNALAAVHPVDSVRLGSLDSEIAQTRTRHDDTARDLAAAETKRGLAVQVLASSVTLARQLHRDMQRLRQTAAADVDSDNTASTVTTMHQLVDPEFMLDSIDEVHDHAVSTTITITNQLNEAMAILATINSSSSIQVSGYSDPSTRSPRLWWEMIDDVPADVLAWAEATARQLIQTHDAHDARITTTAQSRPAREVILLADTMWRFGWIEGSARMWDALALQKQTAHVAQIVSALMSEPEPRRYYLPSNERFVHPERTEPRVRPEPRFVRGARMLRVALTVRPLDEALAIHDEAVRTLSAEAVTAILFERGYSDVVQMFVKGFRVDSSRESTKPLVNFALRSMSAEAILALVDEVTAILRAAQLERMREDQETLPGYDWREPDWWVLWAFVAPLPLDRRREVGVELLVRIWMRKEEQWLFGEMFATLYRGRYDELLADLLVRWPPPLDQPAKELAEMVFRTASDGYRRTGTLKFVARALKDAGVDPALIFGPKTLDIPHLVETDD